MNTREKCQPENLIEALVRVARSHPERGIAIFDGRGRNVSRRTYPEVLEAAGLGARRLYAHGVRPGDRVIVSLPTSWSWVEAWLGTLQIGGLPLAMAPASTMGSDASVIERVSQISDLVEASTVVAGSGMRDGARRHGYEALAARILTPEELADTAPVSQVPAVSPDTNDTAFLQLTSGSTGIPRAVMISHRAALHNNLASSEAIGAPHGGPVSEWADCMVSWLPLHHDMGLVGCLFMSITNCLDLWLLNPSTFLARPRIWLDQLGRHGVAFTPAPNFGYQLCLERTKQDALAGIDLSEWRAAMIGAEMIRPETVHGFAELTDACGFDPRAIRPCYGLAEAALAATFDLRGEGMRTLPVPAGADAGLGLNKVVSLGSPLRDTNIRIAAPNGNELADGEIGEVWIKGPGIFDGYYNDLRATEETLREGWLRSGDLGFLHDEELYLTGRTKDVLIIRGVNMMPHELEWIAESAAGGGGSQRCGAFSVAIDSSGEQAVLVMETGLRDPLQISNLARDIRVEVGRAVQLPLADVVLVRRGALPKTTSGKVRRRELRQQYLDGVIDRLDCQGRSEKGCLL